MTTATVSNVWFPSAVRCWLAGGVVALSLYYALPAGLVQDTIFYPQIGLVAAAAIVAGTVWLRPEPRLPWLLFAAGQALFAIGDLLFGIYDHVLHDDRFPSPADGLYLAGYPVLAAGLVLLVRQRSSGRDLGTLIDAAIVTVALGVVAWVLLMFPFANDDTLSVVETAFSMAYPLGDVLLIAVAARLVLAGGERSVSFTLIALSLVYLLVADFFYMLLSLDDRSSNALAVGWIVSYVLWAAAALHPSMKRVAEPAPETVPKLTPLRLALLAAATLTAPAILAYRLDYVAVAGAGVLALLVIARLSGIVGGHERALARESRLRATAATLVAATSDEEIHRATVETAAGFADDGGATLSIVTPHGVVDVASAGALRGRPLTATFPLTIREQSCGTLTVHTEDELGREERQALETLAAQAALALETVARAREQAERASEARFRSLVQNSSDVIAIVAPDTTIRWLGPSVETTLGYSVDTLVDTRLTALVHPDDAQLALAMCAEAGRAELRLRHADGRWVATETIVTPRLDDETIGGIVLTTRDVTERKELEKADADRARVRDMFSRFVPEAVAEQLLAEAGESLRLGGETLQGTIMFTDLRNFTSFSESRPAHEVITVVNEFLSEQTDAILAYGGTIIAYLGDGLMAAFGAPIEQADHADRALAASRELLGERLPVLNEWMREQGYGDGFRMGIGLNSGPFISGNVGNERRLEYTAIGDVCNTAARIQELTKGTRHMLLFSDVTLERLATVPDDAVDVGPAQIRGRLATTRLWSLERVSDA